MFGPIHRFVLGASLALGATLSQAATLAVTPANQTSLLGSTINVAVNASELFSGTAPSLGAFDVNLSYDAGVLSFVGLSYGGELDVLELGSVRFFDATTLGLINIGEVSLDTEADLNALQLGAFDLFTVTFQAVGVGTSNLTLGINSLADAAGGTLIASSINGSVNVAPVPLPAAAWLLISGVAGLAGFARKRHAV